MPAWSRQVPHSAVRVHRGGAHRSQGMWQDRGRRMSSSPALHVHSCALRRLSCAAVVCVWCWWRAVAGSDGGCRCRRDSHRCRGVLRALPLAPSGEGQPVVVRADVCRGGRRDGGGSAGHGLPDNADDEVSERMCCPAGGGGGAAAATGLLGVLAEPFMAGMSTYTSHMASARSGPLRSQVAADTARLGPLPACPVSCGGCLAACGCRTVHLPPLLMPPLIRRRRRRPCQPVYR
jgi:hypothetical protein